MKISDECIKRFWSKVRKLPGRNACWEWTASPSQRYGLFWFNDKYIGAHRFVWLLSKRRLPKGKTACLMHTCDNMRCVRLSHLKAGTTLLNSRDRDSKGRRRTPGPTTPLLGEQQPLSKLTAVDVRAIRRARASGKTYKEIAATKGVSAQCVFAIIKGRKWKHV